MRELLGVGWRSAHGASLLTLRLALRELRGGVRGFAVFLACIALGVGAIAGIGSSAESLAEGLAREGQVILGGDVAFSLVHREAGSAERAFLDAKGERSTSATMRAMARTEDGRAALVEVKAVDGRYPLYGAVGLDPAGDLKTALAPADGAFGAVAEPTLLARLGIPIGARLRVGSATIVIRACLTSEPDRLSAGLAFGPRLIVSDAALAASGLVRPGSLVRWTYRLRLATDPARTGATNSLVAEARARFPDAGWDIRTRDNASPDLGRNIRRFTQFLTLVGLTALLVGGVGVANAVKSYLDRKRDVIATLKALGATGARVFSIYLIEVVILAAAGILIGLLVGAALPFLIVAAFAPLIPVPIVPALHPAPLLLALIYGLLTALAFALWPLGRAHDLPVSALFRDTVAPTRRLPRLRYKVAAAATLAVLAGFAVALAYDRHVAAVFVAAAATLFVVLRAMALILMAAARRIPRPRSSLLRLALADLHRPGALTPTIVLSLGVGLALLVALAEIDGNLRREFSAGLPERAPSFYFLDIQQAEAERFDAFIRAQAPDARLERVPMLRGRIVSLHGTQAEAVRASPDVAWVLRSDRGISDSATVPAGSRVVAGRWWAPDYAGPPLVSLEARIAAGLGLKLGDPIVVNVLGRNIAATVANLRAVDWETLGINFVLVFSPNTFRGAPHADIATLTYADGGTTAEESAMVSAAAAAFPTITTIQVKGVLDAVAALVRQLMLGIRGASAVTLVAAILVLGGALATGQRHRLYDAVVLKTLGAPRRWLLWLYMIEYLFLGLATALFGVTAGAVAAGLVVQRVMEVAFVFLPGPAVAVALSAVILTVMFGLAGAFVTLGRKPGEVLRHL
jgi:putative ABC transport system permease protein